MSYFTPSRPGARGPKVSTYLKKPPRVHVSTLFQDQYPIPNHNGTTLDGHELSCLTSGIAHGRTITTWNRRHFVSLAAVIFRQ